MRSVCVKGGGVLVCYLVTGQFNTEAIDHHAGKNVLAVKTLSVGELCS